MNRGFTKGLATGIACGLLLAGTSVFAATKMVQAQLVSSVAVKSSGKTVSTAAALRYKGQYYINLNSVEKALQTSGAKFVWKAPVLSLGQAASTRKTTSTSKTSKPAAHVTGLTFSNLVCKDDGLGDAEVDGIAINHDGVTHTALLIVSFYDKSGKLIGTGNGAVDSLAGGQSIAFQTISQVPFSSVASFKVQVQTMM